MGGVTPVHQRLPFGADTSTTPRSFIFREWPTPVDEDGNVTDNQAPPVQEDPRSALPLHSASLLINTDRRGWSVPATTAWHDEATLRDLLVENPSLLPGVTDPRTAAVEEFSVPGVGRIDVLAVESDGTITVCEAKLATNAEMRRTIVGQVLAYASGLFQFDLEQFEANWLQRAGRSLTESVLDVDADESERQAFRAAVANNLTSGTFRIMLAVDVLSTELQSIITYLALHMNLDVVALELAYASSGGVEILVPRSYGTELAVARGARAGRGERGHRSQGHRSNPRDALEALVTSADHSAPGFGTVVASVLTGLGERVSHLYSGDESMLDPVVVAAGEPARQPAKIITSQRTTGIRVCFGWCHRLDRQQLESALRALEANPRIAPIVTEVRGADFTKRPLLPYVGVLEHPDAVRSLIDALVILANTPN